MSVEGLDGILRNLDAYHARMLQAAKDASGEIAGVLEASAKMNHPWMRDTGMTDATTLGTWEQTSEFIFTIVLSAGMDYDVFLELARGGKWAWLWKAMEANRDKIRAILVHHFSV